MKNTNKIISLKMNEVILFENRFYRIEKTAVSNGRWKGRRVILKLIRDEELTKEFIKLHKKS